MVKDFKLLESEIRKNLHYNKMKNGPDWLFDEYYVIINNIYEDTTCDVAIDFMIEIQDSSWPPQVAHSAVIRYTLGDELYFKIDHDKSHLHRGHVSSYGGEEDSDDEDDEYYDKAYYQYYYTAYITFKEEV